MDSYEKLGAFYLGRRYEPGVGPVASEPLLYDAKDLTTHAVCVGMTGSGKTGLGVVLLEEALIDGVPVIAIDPKGDLGNLLLTFPNLQAGDFQPWIDPGEAARKGRSAEEHARATADLWREGLADWDQEPQRIARFAGAAERTIYTPGSRSGLPLAVLRSLNAPPAAVAQDPDALRERILAAVSGLLGLLGLQADPIRSREHILISTLLERAWLEGRDLDIPSLIHQIQKPPVERIGVMELDAVFPSADRLELAMTLNNLVASPGFSVWNEGQPLDIGQLLYTPDGRPKLSILSIAHLSEPERMFLVTLVLNELVSWMRAQPGTQSLRALLYMDEVFGYFPPTANPPSKTPMLTLLKQARAYGLGVVLATQNPVDLDYKGLANAGTWFLGRLQTERDKARVIEGLEGASAAAGSNFDRAQIERTLAGLDSRVFLMNNVHEDEPVLFHTRWALSYLAGPLTREQIKRLTPQVRDAAAPPGPRATPSAEGVAATAPVVDAKRPLVPDGVAEAFLPVTRRIDPGTRLVYRPALLGTATLHHVRAGVGVDEWGSTALLASLPDSPSESPWKEARVLGRAAPELESEPEMGASFSSLPGSGARATSFKRWQKMLTSHVYRTEPMVLWKSRKPKLVSQPGETEGEFRGRLRDALREQRDAAVEKLRKRYAPKLARLRDQIARAEQQVEREQDQYREKKMHSAISIGATVVGAIFGRKLGSSTNVGRAATAARGVGRAARERGDIGRAEERVEALRARLATLEENFLGDQEDLTNAGGVEEAELSEVRIAPRKSDLAVPPLTLVWTPWVVGRDGIAELAASGIGEDE